MSFYSKVTEQDLINLRKLAQQQKEQRALKIKKRILKQTHDIKLAESLSPVTKKVEESNKSTKKIGAVIKESNSEDKNNQDIVPVPIESDNSEGDNTNPKIKPFPNSSIFSDLMTTTLRKLISSLNSLKIKPDPSGATILGVPVYTLGGDKLRIRDNDYDLTPEIYKALSFTGYTGKSMKKESGILMMSKVLKDLGYISIGDRDWKRKTFFTKTLPKVIEKIQNKIFDDFKDN